MSKDKLTKNELLGIIEWATSQINEIDSKPKPVRGNHTVAYYCPSNKGKKWKIEIINGGHIKYAETREEAVACIEKLETKYPN